MSHMDALAALSDDSEEEAAAGSAEAKKEAAPPAAPKKAVASMAAEAAEVKPQPAQKSNDYFRKLMMGIEETPSAPSNAQAGQKRKADELDEDGEGEEEEHAEVDNEVDAESAVQAAVSVGYADLLKVGLRKDEATAHGRGRGKGRGKKGGNSWRIPRKEEKVSWHWGRGDGSLGTVPRGGTRARGRGRGAGAGESEEGDGEGSWTSRPKRAGLGS
eukprot:TRINITY_DN12020_c4_g1_i2.p1 TRINITY_DN12020_c4_g1~~TRINITY_DN12020_c4_g1_i2.p1  ORF type:complete len:251 (+),score=72.24 TRINITY_DN12020_c4_g1_i2:106-753(+)